MRLYAPDGASHGAPTYCEMRRWMGWRLSLVELPESNVAPQGVHCTDSRVARGDHCSHPGKGNFKPGEPRDTLQPNIGQHFLKGSWNSEWVCTLISAHGLGISNPFYIWGCRYLWQSSQHFWPSRWFGDFPDLPSHLEASTLCELHGYFPGSLQPLWRHRDVHRFHAEALSSVQPSGWEWLE